LRAIVRAAASDSAAVLARNPTRRKGERREARAAGGQRTAESRHSDWAHIDRSLRALVDAVAFGDLHPHAEPMYGRAEPDACVPVLRCVGYPCRAGYPCCAKPEAGPCRALPCRPFGGSARPVGCTNGSGRYRLEQRERTCRTGKRWQVGLQVVQGFSTNGAGEWRASRRSQAPSALRQC
jgi:hypothetical protein